MEHLTIDRVARDEAIAALDRLADEGVLYRYEHRQTGGATYFTDPDNLRRRIYRTALATTHTTAGGERMLEWHRSNPQYVIEKRIREIDTTNRAVGDLD